WVILHLGFLRLRVEGTRNEKADAIGQLSAYESPQRRQLNECLIRQLVPDLIQYRGETARGRFQALGRPLPFGERPSQYNAARRGFLARMRQAVSQTCLAHFLRRFPPSKR